MKTWKEKLNSDKPSIKKHIDKAFAGMPAGCLMYISTPLEIDAYIKKIPHGQSVTVKQVREQLASSHDAEHTCPVTTGIFLRIVAEAAYDELNEGKKANEITPFWRVVETDSPLAKKLSCGSQFISDQRAAEGI